MRIALLLAVVSFAALLGAQPARGPAQLNPFAFIEDFKITHYLESAVEIQRLDLQKRADRLKEIAADPQHASELYPLCRMLFDAKPDEKFRRPLIGGPMFIDGREIANWPLEPITIRQNIPILVATGYVLGGHAEEPEKYLAYCLDKCQWRDVKYAVAEKSEIKKEVEAFIASNPKFAARAEWLRQQAE